MYTYTWYQWIIFFYLYCFFGWIFESTYVSLKQRKLVNRGFLRLPMLPLYGSGAVMMLWVSLPFQNSLVLTYLSGVVGATALEYVTGYVMEQLFKIRYWDYSDQRWNLHGYICLGSSLAWGLLTIFMTEVIHHPIARMVSTWNPVLCVFLVLVVSVVFFYDVNYSVRRALDLGKSLEALSKMRGELEGIQVQAALFKMEAAERLESRMDLVAEHRSRRLEWYEDKLEHFEARTGFSLDELREKAEIRLEALTEWKDLAQLHLGVLKDKTEQQVTELMTDTERRLNTYMEKNSATLQKLLQANPSMTSRQYKQTMKELKDYLDEQKLNSPQ